MHDITIIVKKTKTEAFGCLEAGAGFEYSGLFYIKVTTESGPMVGWNAVDMQNGILAKFHETTEVYPLKTRIEYDYI